MQKTFEKQLVEKAKALAGIEGAAIINADTIETGEWVRQKCRFGCGGYGSSLMCPPNSPAPAQTAELLKCYSKALLLHSHDYKNMRRAALAMEKHAFLSGLYKALGLSCGPCDLCKECTLEEGCRHPEKARPSMEACGIDVFSTVRSNGFSISVLDSTDQIPDYYAVVLLE